MPYPTPFSERCTPVTVPLNIGWISAAKLTPSAGCIVPTAVVP